MFDALYLVGMILFCSLCILYITAQVKALLIASSKYKG